MQSSTRVSNSSSIRSGMRSGTRQRRRTPRVITVTSGKGGVGKTNFTANLAWQLCQMRRKVMILDADLGLANIDIVLAISSKHNLSHVLSGEKQLSEIVIQAPGGIKVLPASSGVVGVTHITDDQKIMLLQQIEELLPEFDFLLIDTCAGISQNVIYFALAAHTVIVVLTPEPASLADAYALIKVLSTQYRQTEFKVLVNEAGGAHEAMEVFKRLTVVTDRFLNVSIDPMGYLPRDSRIRDAVRAQKLFMEMYPNGAAAQAVRRVSRRIVALENEPVQSDLGLLWRNLLLRPAA